MVKFLNTENISSEISNVISKAKKRLTLVSPYLKIDSRTLQRLYDAAERGVEIVVVYGKQQKNVEYQIDLLMRVKGLKMYYLEELHAKCYFNESHLVITSMNLHEYSKITNREVGVLLDSIIDEDVYRDAVDEVESIIQAAIRNGGSDQTKDDDSKVIGKNNAEAEMDYCINCGKSIPYDGINIQCDKCQRKYGVWG